MVDPTVLLLAFLALVGAAVFAIISFFKALGDVGEAYWDFRRRWESAKARFFQQRSNPLNGRARE
jgi:hypothetical protein